MSTDMSISEGLIKKFEYVREFAELDHAQLQSLTTDDIGRMYIECQVLRRHVMDLARAVMALEHLVKKGIEPSEPFSDSTDLEDLLGGGS